ncbi:MAG: TIGR04086 family membrane protein [Candidatus Heimdallarchaeota archaeon]
MIQALWIITETGQCIFSHKYVKMDIEDQLISGLLTAFNAFSTESGIGGLQQIAGEDNQFVYGYAGKLLVACLADKRDNPKLVEKLMIRISEEFQEKYAMYLNDAMYVDINIFLGFEDDIDQILFPKIFRRGVGSTIFGTIVTIALTIGALFLMISIPIREDLDLTFLVFLACIPGLFVGALVAGKRSYALIATTVGILPIMGYFAYAIANPTAQTLFVDSTILIIVLMIEQFLAISILCSMLGGSIVERRRLLPFAKGIERAEGINYFDKEPEVEELTLSQQLTQEPYPQAEIPQPETYQPEGYYTQEEEQQPPAEQEKQQDNWDQL